MATKSQIDANRKNSQHSTGPTSESGKSTSSLNNLQHGLASSQLLIPGESEDEFNTLLTALIAEHQPATTTETLLVQDIAKHHWLANRALRLQSEAIGTTFASLDKIAPLLALLLRYQTANERAFHKSLATLIALRKAAQAAIGFASKSAEQAAKQAAKQSTAPTDAEAQTAYNEWHARFLHDIAPPMTFDQMIAAGFVENPETGDWEKHVTPDNA